MKLTIVTLTISACCFFTPIKSSYYLIKVAEDKANSTNEEILHYQPNQEKGRGEEEKTWTPHAKKPDHSKDATAGRVSHSGFSQSWVAKHPKNADADAKMINYAYSGEADDREEDEEGEINNPEAGQYEGRTDDNVVASLKQGNDYNEGTCKARLKIKPCSGNWQILGNHSNYLKHSPPSFRICRYLTRLLSNIDFFIFLN